MAFVIYKQFVLMSKRKQIDNITTTQANTIIVRFVPTWATEARKCKDPEKALRTLAREYCRKVGKTPKEVIATPLPR